MFLMIASSILKTKQCYHIIEVAKLVGLKIFHLIFNFIFFKPRETKDNFTLTSYSHRTRSIDLIFFLLISMERDLYYPGLADLLS